MLKITINSQKEGQFWLEKQTQAEVDEYIQWAYDSAHWGKPAYTEIIPEVLEIKNELGEIIQAGSPAQEIQHDAEYTIEVTDITAQVEQERINIESLAYLTATDWMILRELENPAKPMPDDIKAARQAARDRIVKGV